MLGTRLRSLALPAPYNVSEHFHSPLRNLLRRCADLDRLRYFTMETSVLNSSTNWWAFCHTTKSSNLAAGVLTLAPEF